MNEDEKMFQIGLWMVGGVLLLTVGLQVCYRTQDRVRKNIRSETVLVQKEIAKSQASFAASVRPEVLRNSVVSIAPKSEVIGFHKSVQIDQLKSRGE